MKISVEQLKYQQFEFKLSANERGIEIADECRSFSEGRFLYTAKPLKGFGLTYIKKELSECFQRAIHVSLVFRDWWDKGLHHAKFYQLPQGVRNYPIVNRPASTIHLAACVTNEFDLIVDESGTSFYAELSDQHSNKEKAGTIQHRKPDRDVR